MIIDVDLEEWPGSPVIRERKTTYRRQPAADFGDEPAKLTPRQRVFYSNLMRLAIALESVEIPVDFELPNGTPVFLDRGCIKIAEHAGFIEPLQNGRSETLEHIRLAWGIDWL
jgi:hypothetical protein